MKASIVSTAAALAIFGVGAAGLASTRGEAATSLVPAPSAATALAPSAGVDTAVFAGGCFWGIEAVFEHVKGVTSAVSGYTGGTTANPSYDEVSSGDTGHAESVRVIFDPSQVSYAQLLQVFFSSHDPTQLNHQDPDHGTQYRTAVFYRTPEQKRTVDAYLAQLAAAKTFRRPVVTQVAPLGPFYEAEGYHQDYLAHHPTAAYIVAYDAPKLVNLKARFPALYR